MRKVLVVCLFAVLTAPLFAQSTSPVNGYCTLGGKGASVSGINSTNFLQGIIPGCTVTVYLHGTQSLATIYADSNNTPLANPFRANSVAPNSGAWIFWAATAQGYDVVGSGGVGPAAINIYPAPVTLTEVFLPAAGGASPCGASGDVQYSATTAFGCDPAFNYDSVGQVLSVVTVAPQVISTEVYAADFLPLSSDIFAKANAAAAAPGCTAGGASCRIHLPAGTAFTAATQYKPPTGSVTQGAGKLGTQVTWTPGSGSAVFLDGVSGARLEDFTVRTTTPANTSACIQVGGGAGYTNHTSINNVGCALSTDTIGFAKNFWFTGTDSQPSGNTVATDLTSREYTVCGICTDHTVDLEAVNVEDYADASNTTGGTAVGALIDTGTSGAKFVNLQVGHAGTVIQNSMPTTGNFGNPPAHIWFANSNLADLPPNDGLLLALSLNTESGNLSDFIGWIYKFTDDWVGGSTGSGSAGMHVQGGYGIQVENLISFANQCDGIWLDYQDGVTPPVGSPFAVGGRIFEAHNTNMVDNNRQGQGSGCSDVHISANTGQWAFIGGNFQGTSATACCNGSDYAFKIDAGDSEHWEISTIDASKQHIGIISAANVTSSDYSIYRLCAETGTPCPTFRYLPNSPNQKTSFGSYNLGLLLSSWQSSHSYTLHQTINDSLNEQIVTTPGTSGVSSPTWNNTIGGTTVDGTLIWTNVRLSNQAFQPGMGISPSAGYPCWFTFLSATTCFDPTVGMNGQLVSYIGGVGMLVVNDEGVQIQNEPLTISSTSLLQLNEVLDGCLQTVGNVVTSTGSPCGSGGGGSPVAVNGSTVSAPNFNGSTPAAGAGFTNATLQVSGSNVSIEVPTGVAISGTPLNHQVAIWTGASTVKGITPSTATLCLISNGTSADPTFQACPGAGTGNTTSTSLTNTHLSMANGANSIVDSAVTDDGTEVSIAPENFIVGDISNKHALINKTDGSFSTFLTGGTTLAIPYQSGSKGSAVCAGSGLEGWSPGTDQLPHWCVDGQDFGTMGNTYVAAAAIGGTANAITMTGSITAYLIGQVFAFIPTANNTSTTVTFNMNSLGTMAVVGHNGNTLLTSPAELLAGHDFRCAVVTLSPNVCEDLTNTGAGGGSVSLSALTAATTTGSLNNGANTIGWTWQLAASGAVGFRFLEPGTPGTCATNDCYILGANTASGSTHVKPIRFTAQGTANGVDMTTAGVLEAIGSGQINATEANGSAFAASATTDTTNASNIATGTLSAARLPTALGYTVTVYGESVSASWTGATDYYLPSVTATLPTTGSLGKPLLFCTAIAGLSVGTAAVVGTGNTLTFTLRDGTAGSDTTSTCAITATNSSCSDTSHTPAWTAGHVANIHSVCTGTCGLGQPPVTIEVYCK